MINPFTIPGWNLNRYMISAAGSGVSTLFALSLPLTAAAGGDGVHAMMMAAYGSLVLAAIVQLSRLGASGFANRGGRAACLTGLEAVLWGVAVLSLPALALDLADLAQAPPASERHVFAVVATVFGLIAVCSGLNLVLLLRSRLWASFRAFSLRADG